MQPQTWMTQAKCADMDPTLFDWRPTNQSDAAHTAEQLRAAQLCENCPVIQQCGQYANTIRPSETIYAGIAFPATDRSGMSGSMAVASKRLAMLIGDDTKCTNGHSWKRFVGWRQVKDKKVRYCKRCKRDRAIEAKARKRAAAAA